LGCGFLLCLGPGPVALGEEEPEVPALPGSAETGDREGTRYYPILDWLSDESVVPEEPMPATEEETPAPPRLGDTMEDMRRWNPVVARVNGVEIHWVEVMESGESLPAAYRENLEAVFPALLDRLIDRRLLIEKAESGDIGSDPDIKQRVRVYEEALMLRAFADQLASGPAVARELDRRFDAHLAERAGGTEVRAAHILLATRPEALAVIEKLKEGANFSEMAREHSVATSAARGGDLGYFQPARMAPAFSGALARLNAGEFTTNPVPSKFGWHVIKLKERRSDEEASREAVLAQLKKKILEEQLAAQARALRESAEIELFPEGSSPPDSVQ